MLQTQTPRTLKTAAQKPSLTITDITAEAAKLDAFDNHERVWYGRDEERGLNAIVAIHNTALGPGLGGTRVWPHETFEAALTDVLRLSRGMTFKSAVAGMDFGGGKALIIANSKTDKTPALLEAYAEMLSIKDVMERSDETLKEKVFVLTTTGRYFVFNSDSE